MAVGALKHDVGTGAVRGTKIASLETSPSKSADSIACIFEPLLLWFERSPILGTRCCGSEASLEVDDNF